MDQSDIVILCATAEEKQAAYQRQRETLRAHWFETSKQWALDREANQELVE